ncbi:hypothetical protein ACH347_36375 [Saccharopolyspora sp. 5N102]|uniref:hypothetical protein n=1 Tax=Saccharopolyspora sp. 5N102 TaxID=3375155 RepID=UPI0037B8A36B
MTAPGGQYGLNEAQLGQIISATNKALTDMKTVNNQVQAQALALGDANQSESGRLLVGKFETWSTDFSNIQNQLDSLNTSVQGLLKVGRSAQEQANEVVNGTQF